MKSILNMWPAQPQYKVRRNLLTDSVFLIPTAGAELFSFSQSIAHIIASQPVPKTRIQMSHKSETTSYIRAFQKIVTWLLHRKQNSVQDLIGLES